MIRPPVCGAEGEDSVRRDRLRGSVSSAYDCGGVWSAEIAADCVFCNHVETRAPLVPS